MSESINYLPEDVAISVKNLGIFFRKEALRPQLHWELPGLRFLRKRDNEEVGGQNWIFRNVSFDIKKGEVFGIIGGNGCGKTTMLKIFSKVLFPSEGTVSIRGRVASLLAVGTGFNLDYSGRENVFLNGMILGLSREEIESKYQEIVDFSEVGESIDQPVRTYSSGMRARLAFSVAAQLQSDIVILDEVLSVGDAGFREKSLSVIKRMKYEGRTIILVSHNMAAIDNFCDQAMLIKNGSISQIGEPVNVIEGYLSSFKKADAQKTSLRDRDDREGSGRLRVVDYRLETESGLSLHEPMAGDGLVLCLEYESNDTSNLHDVDISIAFFSEQGYKLVRCATENTDSTFSEISSAGSFKVKLSRFPFAKGNYLIGFRVVVAGEVADYIPNAFELNCGDGDFYGTGVIDNHSPVYVPYEWHADNSTGRT